jgi:hypothetical protein
MILDNFGEFADATALNTGGANTYNVGDIIDLGLAGQDLGNGQPVYAVFQITTAATSGGSATMQFSIVSDSTTTIATDGNQTIHYLSRPVPVATMVAGYQMVVPLPAEDPDYERYLAFQQVTATAAFTAGNVNAFLTLDPAGWKSHPDANN